MQELIILKVLRSRQVWELDDLLTELSKGRARPMSYSSLGVHMSNLRRKGFDIQRRTVYSIREMRGARHGAGSRARPINHVTSAD